MTAKEQVIWECFLMRRDRDLERLWQKAQARDPLGVKFFDGFGKWREKCRRAPTDKAPQCLTCEQTFHGPLVETTLSVQGCASFGGLRRLTCTALHTVSWLCKAAKCLVGLDLNLQLAHCTLKHKT